MAAQGDVRPIIIKRKKKGGGDGHHGGAWKVAYADFVTAMMAFFLLMWLLNATTEQQRSGIADFFSPTAPINRVSGGGNGAFGGDSIFSENTLAQNGSGATEVSPTTSDQARGETGNEEKEAKDENVAEFSSLEEELRGKGGESKVMENLLEHIVTRITDEGLVIELFASEDQPLFVGETTEPTQLLRDLAVLVTSTAKTVTNSVAIGGHVPARPVVVAEENRWDLSGAQATVMRKLLESAGMKERRIERVTGHADREPISRDPLSIRNNRLELVLLRE